MEAQSPQVLIQAGLEAARAGDNHQARHLLTQATAINPEAAEGWFWLGLLAEEPDRQHECIQRALALDPDHRHAQEALARLEAIDTIEKTNSASVTFTVETKVTHTSAVRRLDIGAHAGAQSFRRAWADALVFKRPTVYLGRRKLIGGLFTGGLLLWVVALAVLAWHTLPLAPTLAQADLADLARFLGETLLYGLMVGVEAVLALFAGSVAAAAVARRRFGSKAGPVMHFGLSGMWYIPVGLLLAVLGAGFWLLLLGLDALGAPTAAVLGLSLPVTLAGVGVYAVGQAIYSSAAIHRVNLTRAAVLAVVALLSSALILAWLLPLTAMWPG